MDRPPIRLSEKRLPGGIGDDHYGEERNQAGEQHAIDENYAARAFQIFQLGMGDLAVDLRERFDPAHRQQRMAQPHHDRDDCDRTAPRFPSASPGIRTESHDCLVGSGTGLYPSAGW